MSGLWTGATRGEGYRIARRDGGLIVAIVLLTGTVRLIFRFVSGRPMRGDRKTDAEFFKAGTRQLYRNDRTPGRWSYLPEWRRAAIRLSVLLVAVALLWWWASGDIFDGSMPHNIISAAAIALITAVTWVAVVRVDAAVRDAKHNRALTRPFKTAVAPLLGVAAREVRVHLPRRGFDRAQRTQTEGKEENAA